MSEGRALIFDIQRYSIHDGPGIRTLVFLKGCPLRCPWCSNPEGQKNEPELAFRRSLCTGCGECLGACPAGAIRFQDHSLEIDRRKCNLCGECVSACAPEALSIAGRWMNVEEVLEKVERDRVFYEASRGGITVSGGEPFAQPRFLETFLKACKARGLTTAIETAGYAPWKTIEPILQHCDLILYDIKHPNPLRYRQLAGELTGVSGEMIFDNAGRIASLGFPLALRYTVIPGFNDGAEDREAFFRFAKNLPGIRRIDLLPYHRLGESKYAMLGRDSPLKKLKPLARQDLEIWVAGGKQKDLGVHIVM
jgi:pyruvate formate lyase activating enzyme